MSTSSTPPNATTGLSTSRKIGIARVGTLYSTAYSGNAGTTTGNNYTAGDRDDDTTSPNNSNSNSNSHNTEASNNTGHHGTNGHNSNSNGANNGRNSISNNSNSGNNSEGGDYRRDDNRHHNHCNESVSTHVYYYGHTTRAPEPGRSSHPVPSFVPSVEGNDIPPTHPNISFVILFAVTFLAFFANALIDGARGREGEGIGEFVPGLLQAMTAAIVPTLRFWAGCVVGVCTLFTFSSIALGVREAIMAGRVQGCREERMKD